MNVRKTVTGLAAVVVIALTLALLTAGNPGCGSGRMTTVRNIATRSEEKTIASILTGLLHSTPTPSLDDNKAIHQAVLGSTNIDRPFFKPHWTNAAGEALDMWGTPYQIQIVQMTNFIIRSAGKNCILGDRDDVVFDSSEQKTVKP